MEEKPRQVVEDNTKEDTEITKEMSHDSQESEAPAEERIKDQAKPPSTSSEESTKDDTSTREPHSMPIQLQPEARDSVGGRRHATSAADIPRDSPTLGGDDFQKESKDANVRKLHIRHPRHAGSDHPTRIITLAGENEGASMYIGRKISHEAAGVQKEHQIDMHPSAEGDGKKERSYQTSNEVPSFTEVNSNVQSVNNSLLRESSCSQENPGVYLFISIKTY
ncbi:hypothetical protein B296_00039164 [Ensete ventricosum]|uniref:Uncharacterized protein n=1 Tax=Ensete ventricosum TaxID=4639 RepID=A0A426YRJ3_ENSVE|nr:hypothetical protein B296_00039164 [Ensete ventricosum]